MEKYGKIHSQWMYSKWCVNRKTSKEKVDCPAMFDEQRVKLIFTHSEMEVTLRIPWLILENLQKIRLRLGSLYRIPRFIIYIYIYFYRNILNQSPHVKRSFFPLVTFISWSHSFMVTSCFVPFTLWWTTNSLSLKLVRQHKLPTTWKMCCFDHLPVSGTEHQKRI